MEAIVERIVEKCIQSKLIEEKSTRLDGILATTKIHELWWLLYSRLLWSTRCAATASDSFEFWVGVFTRKDKWASYANSIFLLYHLFIL